VTNRSKFLTCLTAAACGCQFAAGDTTIDANQRYGYGANIGWVNFRWGSGSPVQGATIGQFVCRGRIYSANVGWINLGDGNPANGVHYSNTSATDFGVNHNGQGRLSGYAYGANIGWIKFDHTIVDPPRINLKTGKISGFIYSANCGWMDMGSNGAHFVQSNNIESGPDTDLDLIADSWELEQATASGRSPLLTHLSQTTDADGDGQTDAEEYLADSNPFDSDDFLRVLNFLVTKQASDNVTIQWTSSPRRLYTIGANNNLGPFTVNQNDIEPSSGAVTSMTFTDLLQAPRKFWRVGAKLPLSQ
jgi:hypothetical protein